MNENIDLVKILKDIPKGAEFYSSIFGKVIFDKIFYDTDNPKGLISVVTKLNDIKVYYYDGKYNKYFKSSECTLFPSKDQRDWSKFKHKKVFDNKETYTKGPWFVNKRMPGFGMDIRITRFEESSYWKEGHVARVGDYPLATIHTGHKNWTNEYPVEENAKLIAAAPELLEALEPFTWFPDEDFIEEEAELSYTLTVRVKDIIAAKRAIKKATK